jgi:glycosyltransferase involved in cell wall biosynthesis
MGEPWSMANTDNLKVLLLIPNLGRGGAQKVFHHQLKFLSDGFEVIGCVFNWSGAFPEDHNKQIISLNVPEGRTYFSKLWYFILRVIRLRRIKRQNQIDVSISHLEGADYVNLLSRCNDKVICWIHGTKKYDENISGLSGTLRMKILIPRLYRRADKLVTVSKGIASELSKHIVGTEEITQTIYNGFEQDKIIALSNESLDAKFVPLFQHRSIVTHCRLSRQKNLAALILIFSQLSVRGTMKLIILGDGELREGLLSYCNQIRLNCWNSWGTEPLDLSYEVYFLGEHRNPFKFLRRSTLYMMTSGWEGFPLALCEAMVCGLPVMASDCFTGPREIIAPEIRLPQPIAVPYSNAHGILMPLPDVSRPQVISTWVKEAEKFLEELTKNGPYETQGINRIKQFALVESLHQTLNLIREISV